MKTEAFAPPNVSLDDKSPPEARAPRGRRGGGRRRTSQGPALGGPVRFFLSQSDSNGVPSLEREYGSEAEVMLESLKTGRTYFVISEWKTTADLSKKVPQIRKECIAAKKSA